MAQRPRNCHRQGKPRRECGCWSQAGGEAGLKRMVEAQDMVGALAKNPGLRVKPRRSPSGCLSCKEPENKGNSREDIS